jgi:cyclic beta-1,2-glucan synthetase
MAAADHSSVDLGLVLPLPVAPELFPQQRVIGEQVATRPKRTNEDELRSYAQVEADAWKPVATNERMVVLESRWKEADQAITQACRRLQELDRAGSKPTGDALSLLENSGLLRAALRDAHDGLGHAGGLPQIARANSERVPRAYAAAKSFLRAVKYDFDDVRFSTFLTAVQEDSPFGFAELWMLKSFTQLALLEGIGKIAGKLGSAEPIDGQTSSVQAREVTLPTLVNSVRRLDDVDWKQLFYEISETEKILRQDPLEAYDRMEFESREAYWQALAELAAHSQCSEQEIAHKAVALARAPKHARTQRAGERRSHVGYYLVDEGRNILKQEIGYRSSIFIRIQEAFLRRPEFPYIIGIELGTLAVMALLFAASHVKLSGLIVLALFLLPAIECAVATMNLLATQLVRPKLLPKLDFSEGIPRDCTTMVVIPTLAISEEQVRRAVKDLEVRYLANRDAHLHFALLTDPPDSVKPSDEKDALAGLCSNLIQELNEKYAGDAKGSFFHFHRHRTYNASEGIWMGWERKRGKLLDFNNLILNKNDSFPVKTGNLSILPEVKYVITLDLDTQLPRDSARKLVGALAHPLNRAVIDPATNTVVEGYGILQPRVGISIKSAGLSRLAAICSADTGFDIYTRAISDVYQDLFGEGIFTGKGIYEVEAFQQVLEHRFPCNAVLSHDLIEGCYARAGLLSDVEVVDDYPSHFSAYSRRKHRWVRGDWQIVLWLLPRVRNYFGEIVRNPLSLISRWKIIDNLRRSLSEFATFLLFLCCWLLLPGKAAYWTIATLAILSFPTYLQFGVSIARAGRARYTNAFWKKMASDFLSAHANLFFRLTFLCHQSLLTLDAVVRTVVRMTITHKRLLEWETAAEAELVDGKSSPAEAYLNWTPWLSFALAAVIAVCRPTSLAAALPLLILWGSSKIFCRWLNRPRRAGGTRINARERATLRNAALRTWRFFREFSTADENWLIPDTIQETPPLVAHRISPTNLGFLLDARLAAYDLGFLTLPEFVSATERTLGTIGRMEKSNGHLYNWYDTLTLKPFTPLFVSTVDNGNLVCCLWTLKHGCLEAMREPLFREELWKGIHDHLELIEELLADRTANREMVLAIRELKLRVEWLAGSDSAWLEAVLDLEVEVTALEKRLLNVDASDEARWWMHELLMRLSNLAMMVHDFAPWLLPQFAKHLRDPEMSQEIGVAGLTLESAPRIQAAFDEELRKIIESQATGSESRSAAAFLRAALSRSASLSADIAKRLTGLAAAADALARGMDFAFFLNPKKKLLSIGYDAEKESLHGSHYELLASEARAAVFVAIAKGEIPQQSWFRLGRSFTTHDNAPVLSSWTGTMFEYLLPSLWMKTYPNTILDQSARAALRAQKRFARSKSIPWGISECSCNETNPDGQYRYHAFGIPGLGLKRESSNDIVVSPYSSFLGLLVDAASAAKNLRKMKKMGWLGACGFYEAADFTPARVSPGNRCEIVRCWMAHHQGMSLVAAANVLCDSPMHRRFHAEPMVAATERLLHEKLPFIPAVEFADTEEDSSILLGLQQRLLRPEFWGPPPVLGTSA